MSNEFKNPLILAMNLIRYVGSVVSNTNHPVILLGLDNCSDEINVTKIVGSPNSRTTLDVFSQLLDRKLITAEHVSESGFGNINLTFDGWELYEADKRGKVGGNYGFIAMKFDDPILDPFVNNVVKPAVKEGTGYNLEDMRDGQRAGVIDDIMRVKIRGAAFLIAELTHNNSGAYWEAGYAEGLGKPVIYICEKKRFRTKGTHFDTNHCTTLFWSKRKDDDNEGFCEELIAVIRNSLESKTDSNFSWLSNNPPLLQEKVHNLPFP